MPGRTILLSRCSSKNKKLIGSTRMCKVLAFTLTYSIFHLKMDAKSQA
jgi:hypothetical protein